jgi:hypothetical protein
MIIDTQPPDPPRRRWPFLLGWSLAAMTIVLALFLTHAPASQQASVAVGASQAPSTSASGSTSVIVQQQVSAGWTYGTRQRVDLSRPGAIVLSAPGAILPSAPGAIVYLDYTGRRIAVGPTDNLLTGGTPDSQTTGLR